MDFAVLKANILNLENQTGDRCIGLRRRVNQLLRAGGKRKREDLLKLAKIEEEITALEKKPAKKKSKTSLKANVEYLKKWLSIANIACREFDLSGEDGSRTFLDYSWKDKTDDCESLKKHECKEREECTRYYSKGRYKSCVNKARVKYFEGNELAQNITGSFGTHTYKFKFYYTFPETFESEEEEFLLYSHILVNENDVYVLFGCGVVIQDPAILYSAKVQRYLARIWNTLKDYQFNKLIICGHSAGAVTACRLAQYIYQTDEMRFRDKCIVFGTGTFRWLKDDNNVFKNLPNIFLFVNTFLTKDKIIVDPYVLMGPSKRNLYFPMYFIIGLWESGRWESVRLKKITTLSRDTMKNIGYSNRAFKFLHELENYKQKFIGLIKQWASTTSPEFH